MISGVGADIIRVSRISKSLTDTSGFEESVFSPEEIAYCRKKVHPEQHFAVRFAAKEAFMKALGTGWSGGIRFRDIEIVNDSSGAPFIKIRDPSASIIPELPSKKIHVSLSHDGDYATAYVVIEDRVD